MRKHCGNCGHGEWANGRPIILPTTQVCLECHFIKRKGERVPSNWKPLPLTHGDDIRSEADEKLATTIHAVSLGWAPWCDHHCANQGEDGCDNCIKDWLAKPAEKGE